MTNSSELEAHLLNHDVRPTAVRLLVWSCVSKLTNSFTLADVEAAMPDMDRSSIFRSLRTFAENHLLHSIDDGSGAQKYCVCRCDSDQHLSHVHFSCVGCGRTFCLTDYTVPVVPMPEGFVLYDAEYVVKGLCPKCSRRNG